MLDASRDLVSELGNRTSVWGSGAVGPPDRARNPAGVTGGPTLKGLWKM